MENRGNTGIAGNTGMTTTKAVMRRGLPVLALALMVALPVSAAVTMEVGGGPSVQVAVNGWQ
ncbi:hypothetical protein SAMN04487981_111279 [Streptomyces sp. cf386]|nr:hypothetical protein SAMN04487981_111279 [Streptomyces sp. cf386]